MPALHFNATSMVTAISVAFGLPEATVSWYDRVLREAGLMTKGGRGRGGAKRTPNDLARLMIAILCTDSPAQAADAVRDFGGFRLAEIRPDDALPNLTLEHLAGVPRPTSFEEAVTALMAGFLDPSFMQRLSEFSFEIMGEAFLPPVCVRVAATKLYAEITMGETYYRFSAESGFTAPPSEAEMNAFLARQAELVNRWLRGLRTIREVEAPELVRVSNFLAQPQPP